MGGIEGMLWDGGGCFAGRSRGGIWGGGRGGVLRAPLGIGGGGYSLSASQHGAAHSASRAALRLAPSAGSGRGEPCAGGFERLKWRRRWRSARGGESERRETDGGRGVTSERAAILAAAPTRVREARNAPGLLGSHHGVPRPFLWALREGLAAFTAPGGRWARSLRVSRCLPGSWPGCGPPWRCLRRTGRSRRGSWPSTSW